MKKNLVSLACSLGLVSQFALTAQAQTFTDVQYNHWFYEFVDPMAQGEYITGKTETEYFPNDTLTVAEFSAMVSNAFYGNTLGAQLELQEGAWWQSYMEATRLRGGLDYTTIHHYYEEHGSWEQEPTTSITRYDMAMMIYNLLLDREVDFPNKQDIPSLLATVSDTIDSDYQSAVATAFHYEFLKGRNEGTFDGDAHLTRAEAAVVLDALVTSPLISEENVKNYGKEPEPESEPEVEVAPEPEVEVEEVELTVTGLSNAGGKLFLSHTIAEEGDTIEATVTVDDGYELTYFFVNDIGVTVTNGKASFNMPAEPVRVVATFAGENTLGNSAHRISSTFISNGSVSVVPTALTGDKVTVTLVPHTGYQVAYLNVNGIRATITDNVATFTMPSSVVTLSAGFEALGAEQIPDTNTYTIFDNSPQNGTISYQNPVRAGSKVTVSLAPEEDFNCHYFSVYGADVTVTSGNNKATFTMPESAIGVVAGFRSQEDLETETESDSTTGVSYNINLVNPHNGSIDVVSTAVVDSTVAVTLVPNSGYEVEFLTINGILLEVVNHQATFIMPSRHVSLSAGFSATSDATAPTTSHAVYSNVPEHGTLTFPNAAMVGETVTVTFAPDSGYEVSGFTVEGKDVSVSNNKATFTMPSEAISMLVTFASK